MSLGLEQLKYYHTILQSTQEGHEDGFLQGFLTAFSLMIASELGDKTFFVAAILAMKYSRVFVFLGNMMAMTLMTILSITVGLLFPFILPKEVTMGIAVLLFLLFGIWMIIESILGKEER
mmetsp:Transcript_10424/g.5355  ORF Transcript_10424/g.5355 Transcript_10424/m.5355 type:complete len:120 (-) Transcript_10424:154-513(-)